MDEYPRKLAVTRNPHPLHHEQSTPGNSNYDPSHLLQDRLVSMGQEHLPRGVNEGASPPSLVLRIVVFELTGTFHTIREFCDTIDDLVVQITGD